MSEKISLDSSDFDLLFLKFTKVSQVKIHKRDLT